MLEKNKLEKILKAKINSNDTGEAINVLNNEIKELFIEKVKMNNKNFDFTTTTNLANNVEKYLNNSEINLFKKYYILENEDNNPLYELDCLVNIYNKLKEGDKNVGF